MMMERRVSAVAVRQVEFLMRGKLIKLKGICLVTQVCVVLCCKIDLGLETNVYKH